MLKMTNKRETESLTGLLPAEILDRIFKNLHLVDLKNVVLVCKRWKAVGESSTKWSSNDVTLRTKNLSVMGPMLRSTRLRHVKSLTVETRVSEDISESIAEHPDLGTLTVAPSLRLPCLVITSVLEAIYAGKVGMTLCITENDLSRLDPGLMARAVTKLHSLQFIKSEMTTRQVEAILNATIIASYLKILEIPKNDLSSVKPEMLAGVVPKLQYLGLMDTKLTSEQVVPIFAAIPNGSTLTVLDLSENDLSAVSHDLLSTAVTKMHQLNLTDTCLTRQQAVTIFTSITKHIRLHLLYIGENDLSLVPPESLAEAAKKLLQFNVREANLTPRQLEVMLRALRGPSMLTELHMGDNDLSSVDADLLARSVTKMKILEIFSNTHLSLSPQQVTAILSTLNQDSKLKELFLAGNDLSQVEGNLLAEAIVTLETFDIRDTYLTTRQITQIIRTCCLRVFPRKLYICENDMSEVDEELLVRMATKLKRLHLHDTKLTYRQINAILLAINNNECHLTDMDLSENRLSMVEPSLVARVVTEIQKVNLKETFLTSEQIESIIYFMYERAQLKHLVLSGNDVSGISPELLGKAVTRLDKFETKDTLITPYQVNVILNEVCATGKWSRMSLSENDLAEADPQLLARAINTLEAGAFGIPMDLQWLLRRIQTGSFPIVEWAPIAQSLGPNIAGVGHWVFQTFNPWVPLCIINTPPEQQSSLHPNTVETHQSVSCWGWVLQPTPHWTTLPVPHWAPQPNHPQWPPSPTHYWTPQRTTHWSPQPTSNLSSLPITYCTTYQSNPHWGPQPTSNFRPQPTPIPVLPNQPWSLQETPSWVLQTTQQFPAQDVNRTPQPPQPMPQWLCQLVDQCTLTPITQSTDQLNQ